VAHRRAKITLVLARLRRWDVWRLFGVLWRANRALAFWWWTLILLRSLLPAVFVIAMGVTISAVQHGDSLAAPLAVLGVTFVVMESIGPLHDSLSANLGARASHYLHKVLMDACVQPLGLGHLENPALADKLSAAREFDLGLTGPSIVVAMPNVTGGFVQFGGGLAQLLVLFGYRWWAPLVLGAGWGSTHYFLRKTAIWMDRHSDEVVEQQRKAGYAYRLTVEAPASKEVRLFGLADWIVGGFTSLRHHLLDLSWRERRLQAKATLWCVLFVSIANVVFFWSLGRDAVNGGIALGSLVVFAQAGIGASAIAFADWDWWLFVAAQPVPIVLDIAGLMAPAGALPAGTVDAAGLPEADIRFDHVRFSYPTSEHVVLRDLDLTIPAGQSLAIVGQNGAGKTTLAKLLCRMYDPTAGAIRVDGRDLREFDLASWRARIAAVFQDYVRYELSLRDNVAPAGAPSDEPVLAALELARAANVTDLDTVLSRAYENGRDLSGGQWQRVALARALCAVQLGAGVVILDEPTAQLDVRGELEIFDRLIDATRGCTTILISHRFSTVRRADNICVVEDGRVVEYGTHDELLRRGGRYKEMFELQASRFGEEDDEEALEHLE
jgi:ABC-type multidrug transport system fused ATPase/permease subunit